MSMIAVLAVFMLIADPSMTKHEELFFNAARLDRSMALRTSDYVAVAKPRMERIASF
jgi:Ala-tRNA(Pro) deacylase